MEYQNMILPPLMMFISRQSTVSKLPANPTSFSIFFWKHWKHKQCGNSYTKNGRLVRDSILGVAHVFAVLMTFCCHLFNVSADFVRRRRCCRCWLVGRLSHFYYLFMFQCFMGFCLNKRRCVCVRIQWIQCARGNRYIGFHIYYDYNNTYILKCRGKAQHIREQTRVSHRKMYTNE